MNGVHLERVMKTGDPARDKFLSRLLGIFSEELVRIWCRDSRSPYDDLGRPTVSTNSSDKGSVLDFCFRKRENGKLYVVEMKCEFQYQNYKYVTLHEPSQLDHHKKPAFAKFLLATSSPKDVIVTAGKGKERVRALTNGGILVWGRVTSEGVSKVTARYGFADILSLESMLNDLASWKNEEFHQFVQNRNGWCNSLFQGINPGMR